MNKGIDRRDFLKLAGLGVWCLPPASLAGPTPRTRCLDPAISTTISSSSKS
jgi:hypothetical protein